MLEILSLGGFTFFKTALGCKPVSNLKTVVQLRFRFQKFKTVSRNLILNRFLPGTVYIKAVQTIAQKLH